MRRRWIRLAAPALLLASGLALAFSAGPPASVTGATGVGAVPGEGNCHTCHSGNSTNVGGAVTILNVPGVYKPDSQYIFIVQLASAQTTGSAGRKWGFEITAVNGTTGAGFGTLARTNADTTTTQIISGTGSFSTRRYVEHTSTGTRTGAASPVSWTLRWTAPDAASSTARAQFFVAGNAANGGGTSASDWIYTAVVVSLPPARVSAAAALGFGTVIVGATAQQLLSVGNSTPAPGDALLYTLIAPAGFTAPGGTFTIAAGAAATSHTISMDTATSGSRAGNLAIASNDPISPTKNVALSGAVLDHCQPTLDSLTVALSDTLDFGARGPGGVRDSTVRVFNLGFGGTRARLNLSAAAITGGGGRFSIVGGFTPQLVGASPASIPVHFDETGATGGATYTADLTFTCADETLPGATSQPSLVVKLIAQAVGDIDAGLAGVSGGSVAWGDYDNDGDLDMLLTGFGASPSKLYRNSGGPNPTFSDIGAGLTGVYYSSVAWGDYDNDGDLDILLTGWDGAAPISKVYRNSGGANPTFSDIGAGLPGVWVSSVAWGDYDNDGDLDILLTGWTGSALISKVYRNSGGANPTFSDIGAGLTGVYYSAVAWGDYDKDGDLDILLTGLNDDAGNSFISKVYRNSGGANPTFSDAGAALSGVSQGSVAWGDYDNDGDLDLLLAGDDGAALVSKVYRNSGGPNPTFSDIGAGLAGVAECSLAWGDYDNDGDLDVVLTGCDGSTRVSKMYRNSGGANPTFSDIGAFLTGVSGSSVAWGDYDNDGDLDILLAGWDGATSISNLYRTASAPNTVPLAPGGLAVTTGPSGTTFSWNAASDAQTPAAGLTYNLRVGTTPGGNEISSAMAAAGGYRKVARLGNANHRLSWTLAVPAVNYYWSVQAVDAAFAGSPFAGEQQTVDVPAHTPIPAAFALHANQPNPFSNTTRISFDLPRAAKVRLRIYDVSGRQVRTLADGRLLPAGRHEVEWDGRGPRGERSHDGVYLCLMETDGFRSTRRMVLAR